MKKSLGYYFGIFLVGLTGWAWGQGGVSDGALTRDEAVKKLELIEKWSRQDKSLEPRAIQTVRVQNAISDLQKNPEVAAPVLADAFVDSSKDRNFRVNCAQLLRETGRPVSSNHYAALEELLRKGGDPLLRAEAAYFLLRDNRGLSASAKTAILDMAERFLKEGKEVAHVRLFIMRQLAGNPRAVEIMLGDLKRGAELGPTLWTLGKLKGRAAIAPISKMLDARFSDKNFPKTRAYLALGEIGGPEAYSRLVQYFGREKDEREQHMILRAIGLTKDARAKNFLLEFLKDMPPQHNYTSALRGLQYLGDPTAIPALENELKKPLEAHLKYKLQTTIAAIREEKTEPEW